LIEPSSFYRIQFSKDFKFKDAAHLIPYLSKLGIEGIYGSPIFEAFSSGYDTLNPNHLSPDLGSTEDFDRFCALIKEHKMSFMIDIIPNHMGIKGDKNIWWLDVLQNGAASKYAKFFDINWNMGNGKVILPILNRSYEETLQRKELQITWRGGGWINYFDYHLPVNSIENLQENLDQINSDPTLMNQLLQNQFYKLAPWKNAGDIINYRRFFNINDLIAIRIEDADLFQVYHQLVFKLIEKGQVQGIRIDHPDGLYNPKEYFDKIRSKTGLLMWVEKILDMNEHLPKNWKVDGTVGYEFLNTLSGAFVEKNNEKQMTQIYQDFTCDQTSFAEINYKRRKSYILQNMGSETRYLASLLARVEEKNNLEEACIELIASFPVYRTYITKDNEISPEDREYVELATKEAKLKAHKIDPSTFDFISQTLLMEYKGPLSKKEIGAQFAARFQQVTAPAMAKGMEDSTFYLYNRLISLNEVGNNPSNFGVSKEAFHQFNIEKLKSYPLGALSSSTHDTKLSEDARARINVLSEVPDQWNGVIKKLREENSQYKSHVDGHLAPDNNTEYYIYQIILALGSNQKERLWATLNKAIREAGTHTSWNGVNLNYETAVQKFLEAILKNPNLEFLDFQKKVAEYGDLNSLSAVILKMGSCGIVDIYQGNELENYCLVDPDNRRLIDFSYRQELLLKQTHPKMTITQKSLLFRKEHKELHLKGDYIPLESPDNIIAFMRKWDNQVAIFIARRFFATHIPDGSLSLPKYLQGHTFQNILTGLIEPKELEYERLLAKYPGAILYSDTPYNET